MALLNSDLSLWEVAHRWAGYDPATFRLRLPLAVRDNCRVLVDAIYHGQLPSLSLQMDMWTEEDGADMKPYFIRHHLSKVWDCVAGKSFDRQFLRWVSIERWELKEWCDRQTVPLPEFWFPTGWSLDFSWPNAEEDAVSSVGVDGSDALRASARSRIACQEIAKAVWRESPDTTIADMVRNDIVRRFGGGGYFSEDALRGWLSAVAPAEVKAKRGRPRKKNPVLA